MKRGTRQFKRAQRFVALATAALMALPAPIAAQDRRTTADEYKDYVDQMIPLTFTFAQQSAQLDEYVVANEVREGAQSDLAQATAAASVIDRLAPLVTAAACQVTTPVTDDAVTAVMSQLLISQQLINAVRLTSYHVQHYHQAEQGLSTACDHGFDHYSIARLNLQFAEPDIEPFDGFYVDGSDPAVFAWTFLKSVWQFFTNANEEQQIKDQSARLQRDRAKDSDIQKDAKQACQSMLQDTTTAFTAYDQLTKEVDTLLAKFPMDQLLSRHERLRQCVSTVAEGRVAQLERAVQQQVHQLLQGQSDDDARQLMNARVAVDLAQQLALLRRDSCALVTSHRAAIDADRSLGDLYALPDVQALSATATQMVTDKLTACGTPTRGHLQLRRPLAPVTASAARKAQLLSSAQLEQKRRQLAANLPATVPAIQRTLVSAGDTSPPSSAPTSVCDLDESDRHPSLCVLLHKAGDISRATFSFSTDRIGGYTQAWTGAGTFTLGYGQVTTTPTPVSEPWAVSRDAVTRLTELPGTYNLERAKTQEKILKDQLAQVQKRSDELGTIVTNFRSGQSLYLQGPVGASLPQSVHHIQAIASSVQQVLSPVLAQTPSTIGDGTPPSNPVDLASAPVQTFARRIESTDAVTIDQLNTLEGLHALTRNRSSMVPEPDRQAIESLDQQFFDANGVLTPRVLSPELVPLANNISHELRTDPLSGDGQGIRQEINRGLFAISRTPNSETRFQMFGALVFVMGADAAYASGARADGDELVSTGAEILDFTLGLIPGVSSINDAAQIVYGLATGHDFAGHRMTSADFALRGCGVVLGLIPAAGAIKIAGRTVTEGFVHGASLVREVGLAEHLVDATPAGRQIAIETVEAVGNFLPANAVAERGLANVATDVEAIIEEGHQIRINAATGATFEGHVLGVLGYPREYTRILVGEATDAAYRVPDYLSTEGRFMVEIKNQQNLTLSNQFRDFISYSESQTPPFVFKLYMRPDATMSAPLTNELRRVGAEVYDVFTDGGIVQRLF